VAVASEQILELLVTVDDVQTTLHVGRALSKRGLHQLDDARQAALRHCREGGGSPAEYGRLLFESAFPGGLADMFKRHRGDALGKTFRLQLDIASAQLHSLWWECLWVPGELPFGHSPAAAASGSPGTSQSARPTGATTSGKS